MVAERVAKAAQGPKSIESPRPDKRKRTDDVSSPILRFKRGFAWSDSSNNISPSALYTPVHVPTL